MDMVVLDIIMGFIFPLTMVVINHLLEPAERPEMLNVDGEKILYRKMSGYMKELPTAFISHAFWGMAYQATSFTCSDNAWGLVWVLLYCVLALLSYALIIYSRQNPKLETYKSLVGWGVVILIVLALLRIISVRCFGGSS